MTTPKVDAVKDQLEIGMSSDTRANTAIVAGVAITETEPSPTGKAEEPETLPGVETSGSPRHYLEPGDFFTHLQSFPQLHLPPLSHPHVFSPQALQLMSFLLPVRHRRFCSMQTHGQGATKIQREEIVTVPGPDHGASPARQSFDRAIASGDTG